jgi:hypothetical protein
VVGLGAQDTLKLAKTFRSRHKIKQVKLLWDSTGKSWDALGIPSQPAWILLNVDGSIRSSGTGSIPYKDVLVVK